jgi:hypothetical protein
MRSSIWAVAWGRRRRGGRGVRGLKGSSAKLFRTNVSNECIKMYR